MLLALPALASAQGTTQFGVKAGFNIANINVDFNDGSVSGDGRAGGVFGLFGARDFNPQFGIQVEGLFTQKGAEFSFEDDLGFDDDSSFKLSYVEFPVLARANFPASTATVRLLAGPTFAFNVNESIKVGGVELDADEVPLKPFEVGFALGGAIQIRKFVIDGRYTWGLTDINDSDDTDDPTVKNRAFSLTFGWLF